MTNIFNTYIPKFIVDIKRDNKDILFVSSSAFSAEGDVYTLDVRTVSPNVIQTTQSLNELKPDVSDVYPYKVVTPIDYDGATILLVPSIENEPTASQHYYAPIYFERYNKTVLNNIDRRFLELTGSLARQS